MKINLKNWIGVLFLLYWPLGKVNGQDISLNQREEVTNEISAFSEWKNLLAELGPRWRVFKENVGPYWEVFVETLNSPWNWELKNHYSILVKEPPLQDEVPELHFYSPFDWQKMKKEEKRIFGSMAVINHRMAYFLGFHHELPLFITSELSCSGKYNCRGRPSFQNQVILPLEFSLKSPGESVFNVEDAGLSFFYLDYENQKPTRYKLEDNEDSNFVPMLDRNVDSIKGVHPLRSGQKILIYGVRERSQGLRDIEYFSVSHCQIFSNNQEPLEIQSVTRMERLDGAEINLPRYRNGYGVKSTCPFVEGGQGAIVVDQESGSIVGFVWDKNNFSFTDNQNGVHYIHTSYILPLQDLLKMSSQKLEEKFLLDKEGHKPLLSTQRKIMVSLEEWITGLHSL